MYREIIDLTDELQYKIELYAAGCVEWQLPGSALPHGRLDERRKLIRQHVISRSFADLAWVPIHVSSSKFGELFRRGAGRTTFYDGNTLVFIQLSDPIAQDGLARPRHTLLVRFATLVPRSVPLPLGDGHELLSEFEVEFTEWSMQAVKPFSSISIDHTKNLLILMQNYREGHATASKSRSSNTWCVLRCVLRVVS